ncbi:MAG TPA: biopolymer transporter ExbD [Pyrinomonadaceae bacterium]|jgi:biopolymer transport protein ExbD
MGMSSGSSSGATPNINVTPLIDVLLVLLIIFMVITPSKPSRFEAKVPAEPKDEDKNVILKPNPNTLIVFINREGAKLRLNQDDIGDVSDTAPLTARLEEVFKDRESRGVLREGTNEVEKTVFIKAPKSVKYGDVVKVIDAVKLADAQPIGLQIDDLEQ